LLQKRLAEEITVLWFTATDLEKMHQASTSCLGISTSADLKQLDEANFSRSYLCLQAEITRTEIESE
jgi:tyrosyl-tRNA synthetase